jgi:SAM-dependent methyltransferase
MKNFDKIKNLLQYTTTSDKSYNGSLYESGYHTLFVEDQIINGQRNPLERLKNVPFNFCDKVILDIGSNQGGMLFAVQDKITEGVGVDFDYRLVNVANRIKANEEYENLNFYVFNLEKENFNLFFNFIKNNTIDIVFLLSICMWINNWKDLCLWCSIHIKYMLFETNGTDKEQQDQINFLKSIYSKTLLINEESLDDPRQHRRKLYLCEN